MSTPILEQSRIKLLNAYIGDVRAWKADDTSETIIFAVKNPAQDADDTSFYALPKGAVAAQYLGTSILGKDGGSQPLVYNDGTIVILLTETPVAGQSGALADLYLVTLQNKLTAEISSSGTVDTFIRTQFKAFLIGLRDLANKFIALIP